MFQDMEVDEIAGAVEAMLFVTDEPVGVLTMADMLECDVHDVETALVQLRDELAEGNRGIQLREVAGGWRLYTNPAYHDLIEKYVISWDTRRLTGAALETLAVIAYTQPTTRAAVASVRGVNSDSSINSLVEKGLVREAGNADAPGNPTLYATTRSFLEKFGLRSVEDLPPLDEFAPDAETRALIADRLSATKAQVVEMVAGSSAKDETDEGKAARDLFELSDALSAVENGEQPSRDTEDGEGVDEQLQSAMARALGLVEKIDFDSLSFDTDDE